MSHEFLAASSAGVWVHCAGAPLLSTMHPEEETAESMEGDAAHWVLAEIIESYKPESQGIKTGSQYLNKRAPNGVVITNEMIECVMVMVNDVLNVCQTHGLLNHMHVEEKLMMPAIHRNNGGTPDLWILFAESKMVIQYDYKHGHLDIPANSWQNINYLSGIKTFLNIDGYMDQEWTVVMKIVQPRGFSKEGPIKVHTARMSDFRADFNLLASQANKAHEPDPGVVAGLHCRYCPARHSCEAARKAAHSMVDYVGSATPEVLSDEALSFEINLLRSAIKMGEYRLEAAEEEALRRIQTGLHHVPGYVIEQSLGKRKFKGKPDELFTLGDLLGIELRGEQKPCTPAEAERRIDKLNKQRLSDGLEAIDHEVIKPYIDRPRGGFKLVEADNSMVVKAFTQAKG